MNLKSCADAVCRLYVLIRAMGLLIFRLCLEWPARLSFYKSYDASGLYPDIAENVLSVAAQL